MECIKCHNCNDDNHNYCVNCGAPLRLIVDYELKSRELQKELDKTKSKLKNTENQLKITEDWYDERVKERDTLSDELKDSDKVHKRRLYGALGFLGIFSCLCGVKGFLLLGVLPIGFVLIMQKADLRKNGVMVLYVLGLLFFLLLVLVL